MSTVFNILLKEVEAHEISEAIKATTGPDNRKFHHLPSAAAMTATQMSNSMQCVYCREFHFSASCDKVIDAHQHKEIFRCDKRCLYAFLKATEAGDVTVITTNPFAQCPNHLRSHNLNLKTGKVPLVKITLSKRLHHQLSAQQQQLQQGAGSKSSYKLQLPMPKQVRTVQNPYQFASCWTVATNSYIISSLKSESEDEDEA